MANKKLNAVITIGGAITGTLKSALGTTKTKLVEIGGAVKQLEREQRNLSNSIGTFARMGKDVDFLRTRYAAVTAEIDKQRRALERVKSVEESRKKNLERRNEARGKLGETAAVGAAILFPAGLAIKRSADFNYQLQVIGNTADMVKPDIIDLGKEMMRISDKAGQSAQTVQGAVGFLIAAGMNVGTAMGVMKPVGRTATATAADIEDVSRAAFTLNDSLKIDPAQMQKALDILVQAGKEGNFEFKAMAANLPQLGASFQALKMVGAEAVATMGAALQIARKGAGDEAEAANNMKNFLAKILSPETLKKARKLGSDMHKVISKAQETGANPMEAAIKEIERITNGGDQKLLGELFQDMQVQNFLRPMLQNMEEYRRIKEKAFSADGVVDRDFIRMSETTKQQFNEMANAAGRASIAIGNSLEPAVGRVLAVLTPVVRTVTDFVNANQALVGNTILVVGGLLAVRVATLAATFGWTILKGAMLSTVPVAMMVGRAILFAGRAVLWLGRALLLNPIGLAVTAIAASAFLIYKYWEPIKGFFSGLWENITASFNKAIEWITGKLQWVGQAWTNTKAFFGFDGSGNQVGQAAKTQAATAPGAGRGGPVPPPAVGSPVPPPLPSAASDRSIAPVINDDRQYIFNVQTQPGQSTKEIADEIERRMRNQQGVRNRSVMYDTVTP